MNVIEEGSGALAWLKVIGVFILVVVLGFLLYKIYGLVKTGLNIAGDAATQASDFITGKEGEHNVASRATDNVLVSVGVVDKGQTLGTTIYDFFHGDENKNYEATRMDPETNDMPLWGII